MIKRLLIAATFALAASPAFAAVTMQCQPTQTFSGSPFPSSGGFTSDADGIVTGVNPNDVAALERFGCVQIGVGGLTMIGRIVGANMNVTTDQVATMFLAPGMAYIPSMMHAKNCSISLTTAAGSVYNTASKGGAVLYGSGAAQAFSACTGLANATVQFIAATAAGQALVEPVTTPPILSLTTAQGAAATANIYFWGYVLGK